MQLVVLLLKEAVDAEARAIRGEAGRMFGKTSAGLSRSKVSSRMSRGKSVKRLTKGGIVLFAVHDQLGDA